MTHLGMACVTATCAALSLILLRPRLMLTRMVKLESFWESLTWSLRLYRRDSPLPKTLEEWKLADKDDEMCYMQQSSGAWLFLSPFFASRGYTLYRVCDYSDVLLPPTEPSLASDRLQTYPYARTIPDSSLLGVANTYDVLHNKPAVWAARDSLGRDVIIKLISDSDMPTNEWLILQRLNDSQMRSNTGNRTIHVIEFITFDRLIFAVMPRWDSAFSPPFTTVSELMDMAKAYLEALDFLHTHRIAHLDIHENNCGMNMYAGDAAACATTVMRKPSDVRYVLYDFGYSLMYPEDTDLSSVNLSRYIGFMHAPSPKGPYNPFKADVSMMGGMLFGYVMHAAIVVPELGPFFYRMMDLDEIKRPTASAALAEFMEIYNNVSASQRETIVDARGQTRIETNLLPDLETRWMQRYGDLKSENGTKEEVPGTSDS